MSYTIDIKNSAELLRREGKSIPSIARKLGVAKSTISIWVQNVALPAHLEKALRLNSADGRQKGNAIRRAMKVHDEEEMTASAHKDVLSLKKSPEFWRMTAALLYWCEGGKRNESSGVQFTNSDPILVKTFLFALRHGFSLDESKFRVLIHLHGYHNDDEQRVFWSQVTKLPRSQFQKSYRKPNTGKRKREDYQGCISLKYYDVRIVRSLFILYTSFAQSI